MQLIDLISSNILFIVITLQSTKCQTLNQLAHSPMIQMARVNRHGRRNLSFIAQFAFNKNEMRNSSRCSFATTAVRRKIDSNYYTKSNSSSFLSKTQKIFGVESCLAGEKANDLYNDRSRGIRTSTKLFGFKRDTPGNPPGKIDIYDEQETLPGINISELERTISLLRDILGYPTYDITLLLVDDEYMIDLNYETRGIKKATDILSFPFQDVIIKPGLLDEPDFDIEDYYALGDMVVDVPYVMRRCEEDKKDRDDELERGVSGAMASVFDPEDRIKLLLVHGMLHLVGYDHIEDGDHELMVSKEEEVMTKLAKHSN